MTKKRIKSSNTLFNPAEGEGEGLTDEEGLALPEGEALLDAEREMEAEGEADFEGLLLGLAEALALPLGDREGLCETEAD